MCSPALQTSGQYTFWLCLVESRVTLRSVGRTHRQAVERRAEVKRKVTTERIPSVCVCVRAYLFMCSVPVDVAMQPLAWAHLPLGQTRHPLGWMTAATS